MDEDLEIINSNTRNEKIKNFISQNKKKIVTILITIIILIVGYYFYQVYKEKNRVQLSDKYNSAIIEFNSLDKQKTIFSMKEIVESKDSTYSPLALYFLLDNNLIDDRNEINNLFDTVINKTSLEYEIKNLIIYKKALFNADYVQESELLNILRPIIQSESVWKSHSLFLIAEYFYSKNEKEKSREFFEKIISTSDANTDIILEAQKRLNRDLSE